MHGLHKGENIFQQFTKTNIKKFIVNIQTLSYCNRCWPKEDIYMLPLSYVFLSGGSSPFQNHSLNHSLLLVLFWKTIQTAFLLETTPNPSPKTTFTFNDLNANQ